MDFLSAVRSLKDGECEGIKRPNWGNHIIIAEWQTMRWLTGVALELQGQNYLAEDWELVNPKPRMERVEVVRYKVRYDNGELSGCRDFGSEEALLEFCPDAKPRNIARLVGYVEVPIPAKVKRREKIATHDGYGLIWHKDCPKDVEIFAEWTEDTK